MPSPNDFPTTGKVIAAPRAADGAVVFQPRGTTYEMLLKPVGEVPPLNTPARAIIRAQARKVWTVPSGGNFLTPIMGPPKIIQGRVKYADEKQLVVHAAATVVVNLPADDTAVDLPHGAIAAGVMVNVTALPGATIEFVSATAPSGTPGYERTGAGAGNP